METIEPRFDLNLLRVLVALERTRHVTQAAQSLGMSQSGFSTALARLRQRFDDPLFVRTPEGMAPTPRALRMVQSAKSVLVEVTAGVLEEPDFDPTTARVEFRLAMADVAEIVYLPRLLSHLQIHAPHARVTSLSLADTRLQEAMAAGDVDLALGYFPDLGTPSFFQQRLYTHTFACMMRPGHPLAQTPLTEQSYAEQGHAVVSSPARSSALFEQFLKRRGIERHIVLSTPHHLSLPAIVEASDLLATVPLATGVRFARLGVVQLVRLPFVPPAFAVQQHWHRLLHKDARHQWLRAQVAALFSDASDEWRQVAEALYGTTFKPKASAAPTRAKADQPGRRSSTKPL